MQCCLLRAKRWYIVLYPLVRAFSSHFLLLIFTPFFMSLNKFSECSTLLFLIPLGG